MCLLPHQQDHRVLLEKGGHCPSSCLRHYILQNLNSHRKAWWGICHLIFLRPRPIRPVTQTVVLQRRDGCAMGLKIRQERHPPCATHKCSETLLSKWYFQNQVVFQSSSVFVLDWAHVLRGWVLRMPWARSPRAAGGHSQVSHESRESGCCRPLLSSLSPSGASGKAWMRIKRASPAQRKLLFTEVINHCLAVTLMHRKSTSCGFRG